MIKKLNQVCNLAINGVSKKRGTKVEEVEANIAGKIDIFKIDSIRDSYNFIVKDLSMSKVYTCIWSNQSAAEMVNFYKAIFKNMKIGKYSYWGKNPMGVKEGSVLTVHITILGQKIMLLNGYMEIPFNNSFSMVVPCKTQKEIDYYWKKLTAKGGKAVHCGWLIDQFGIRWQIVPEDFDKWNTTKIKSKKEAMTIEMWKMKKLNIKKLKAAFEKSK